MRSFVVVVTLVALAGCSAADPAIPTKVSMQYGGESGDGAGYQGPAPIYTQAYGVGADQASAPASAPTVGYAWGAENQTGGVVQTSPPVQQRLAAPTPNPAERKGAPDDHS